MQHDTPDRPSRRARDSALAQYRLYFMHSVDRLISYSHEFETESDERAVSISEAWLEGRRGELWSGDRKVKSWEAND